MSLVRLSRHAFNSPMASLWAPAGIDPLSDKFCCHTMLMQNVDDSSFDVQI